MRGYVSMTAPCRPSHVFVAIKVWLSRQKFCRDNIMFVAKKKKKKKKIVAKNTYLSRHIFAAKKVCLSRQEFCRDRHHFVATKLLSRQVYFCRDKKDVFCRYVCREKTDACGSSR